MHSGGPALPDSARVGELLAAYQALLDEVTHARHAAPLPRRMWAWTTQRFAIEHVRQSLGVLERRYRARRAIAGPSDSAVPDPGDRVTDLAASLPPSPSPLRFVWLAVGVLVLARIALAFAQAILPSVIESGDPSSGEAGQVTDPVVRVVDQLGAPDPGNLGEIASTVLSTDLLVTGTALLILGVAAYGVLRPLASGAIALQVLCGVHRGLRRRSLYRDERQDADRLQIRQTERAVFDPAGIAAPAYPHTDLIAKACLAAPLLVFAAGLWSTFLAGEVVDAGGVGGAREGGPIPWSLSYASVGRRLDQAAFAAAFAAIAVARLGWLALEYRRSELVRLPPGVAEPRRSWLGTFAAGMGVVVAGFALMAAIDRRPPSTAVLTTAITDRALDRAELRLLYSCNEPCTMTVVTFGDRSVEAGSADPRLADFGSDRKPFAELLPAGSRDGVGPVAGLERASRPPRIAVRALSAQEVRWLREEVDGADEGDLIEAQARVQDAAGRSTWSLVLFPLWED